MLSVFLLFFISPGTSFIKFRWLLATFPPHGETME